MKQFTINIIYFFLIFEVAAQKLPEGLYINSDTKEFICIQQDTLLLKYFGGCRCLGIYDFYYGAYEYQNNKILLKENRISKMSSTITKIENAVNDSVVIRVLKYVNKPVYYSEIYLDSMLTVKKELKNNPRKSKQRSYLFNSTFGDRCASYTYEQIRLFLDLEVVLRVKGLDFETEHLVSIQSGDLITIKLFPFDVPFMSLKDGKVLEYFLNEKDELEVRFCIDKKDKIEKHIRGHPMNLKKEAGGKCGFELFCGEARCQ